MIKPRFQTQISGRHKLLLMTLCSIGVMDDGLPATSWNSSGSSQRRGYGGFGVRADVTLSRNQSAVSGTGREWDGSFHGRPVLDEDGRMVLAFIVFQDITARRQTELALRTAKEQADQANLAKSKFLAAASHDLRQPLQSLLLFTALLNEHVASAKGRQLLGHLGQSLTALKDLLDGLLDISRLDAGVVQPTVETFPLQAFLDEIAATFAPVAAAKGLALEVAPCAVSVRSDRTLLGRMVRNLVDNAVRYTETGRIRLLSDQTEGGLRLEVQDTGVGIPPNHLDRIW
jgi:signal transduction histidine kinase